MVKGDHGQTKELHDLTYVAITYMYMYVNILTSTCTLW